MGSLSVGYRTEIHQLPLETAVFQVGEMIAIFNRDFVGEISNSLKMCIFVLYR